MRVAAIILAAGASRRLGRPKQLVLAGGETLLGRTVRVVREAAVERVFVVLGAAREAIEAAVDLGAVDVVGNAEWGQGIASSIRAGVDAAVGAEVGLDGVMLLVCDQPRLTAEHLRGLVLAWERDGGIAASAYAGIVGIPAIFPASEFGALRGLQGDAGARFLLRNPGCGLIIVPFAEGAVDVDTVMDLEGLDDG